MREVFRVGCVVLAVAVAIVLTVIVALPFVGQSRIVEERLRWEEDGRSLDAPIAASPKGAVNESALELERLARDIGLELAPHDAPRRVLQRSSPFPNRKAREWLEAFIHDADPDAEPVAPPGDVARAFAGKADGWDALVDHLHAAPAPRWPPATEQGLETGPSFSPGAMFELLRTLDVRALLAEQAGDPVQAERTLAAAWRLSEALTEHVGLQDLILPRVRPEQAILVRRLAAVRPEEWLERLARRSHQREFADGLHARAALLSVTIERGRLRETYGVERTVGVEDDERLAPVLVPVLGSSAAARHLERFREAVRAIDEVAPCSAIDRVAAVAPDSDPGWDVFRWYGWLGHAYLTWAWAADVQEELTAKVLEARASDGVVDADWAQSSCPDITYSLEPLEDGGFRVSIDVPSHRSPLGDVNALPLSHVERAGDGGPVAGEGAPAEAGAR